jgi:TusA-related sulfurtransferase
MAESPANEFPAPSAICDGGDLDCGSGLLLIIRTAMAEIAAGEVLEVRSREISVREDLPAWCRMVKHEFLGAQPTPVDTRYFVRKGQDAPAPTVERPVEQDLKAAMAYTWTARLRWLGDRATTVYARNHAFTVGQPASFKATDPHPSAVEYLLGALGADLTNGFQVQASRAGLTIDAMELSLTGQLGNVLVFLGVIGEEGSPGFSEISGTLYVSADADEAILQEVWQTTLHRAPIYNTLKSAVTLRLALRVML